MLKYSLVYCGPQFPQGVSLARDLTKDERETERTKYLNKRQQNSATGASVSDAVQGATQVADRTQTNGANVTSDHLPPREVREIQGT